ATQGAINLPRSFMTPKVIKLRGRFLTHSPPPAEGLFEKGTALGKVRLDPFPLRAHRRGALNHRRGEVDGHFQIRQELRELVPLLLARLFEGLKRLSQRRFRARPL